MVRWVVVVWGVRDAGHAVAGTRFEPSSTKHRGQPLEFRLSQMLRPDVAFSFRPVRYPDGRLVLLEVPAATTAPVEFDRTAYIRIGSATPRLADHPERQRALWGKLRPYLWEAGIARQFVKGDEVLDLLDHPGYFGLVGRPMPEGLESILADLEGDRLISRDVGGKWNILDYPPRSRNEALASCSAKRAAAASRPCPGSRRESRSG